MDSNYERSDHMPFKKINVKEEIKERAKKSEEFKEAYNHANIEYELKKELAKKRKDLNITQNIIAKKSGLKQQEISRIETEGNSPTLRVFLRYLEALNLKIKIEEK